MMVVVFAFDSGGSLGAVGDPNLGALACLVSDPATFTLGQGGCRSEASELLASTVVLSGSPESDKGDDEKFLKHLFYLSKIFIIIIFKSQILHAYYSL